MTIKCSQIRNIAIIAHVDHGKTTLVDKLLQQSGTIKDLGSERVMDSNVLERERGITILAKNTGISYNAFTINIVDTPGHSDFGGEVERTLQMVEGFLLLVDAAEGVLPGTRFVLSKALALNLKPIVLINKIDRKDADIERVENEIHDLFLDLAMNESQLEFSILYGSSRFGFAGFDKTATSGTLQPLLETIIKTIPAPKEDNGPLQLLVTNISHSDYLGPIAIGRIFAGSLALGDSFVICREDFVSKPMKVTKIFCFQGLEKVETSSAGSGEIVAVTGFTQEAPIGSTLCQPENPKPLPYVNIDEPTLSMYISVNDSPFSGREGKLLTSRQIRERLFKELKTNVALRVEDTDSPESFKVSGRGQLHLGVLVENMRREGFELQVSAPEVIFKMIGGVKHEPIELVVIDVPNEHQGTVMENLGRRKGIMKNMIPQPGGRVRIEFEIPSRCLLGFRSQFLTETRGTGLLNFQFHGYEPYKGEFIVRTKGALVSMETGKATAYALDSLKARGILFVEPTDDIYEGMIVGEHSRDNDLDVNPCKEKKLTNMRASGSDEAVQLPPVTDMELEQSMEWIQPDELIEVTPQSIRLRKKILKSVFRK